MRRIFKDKATQRTRDDIVRERSERGRMDVLREYLNKVGHLQ